MRGPFGGVQSELPPEFIEQTGFLDVYNMILRRGAIGPRSPFLPYIVLPNPQEPIVGVAELVTSGATRIQTIMTPTRLLQLVNGAWVPVAGAPLKGGPDNLFSSDVVGQKLCFCQQVDKVQVWDGLAGGYADASPNAVPARFLAEIANHLVVADTIEGGIRAPQRYRWTGAGDPTDWTSFDSGQNDMFNNLGQITGVKKIGQFGAIWQLFGITLLVPTGLGTRPFDRSPVVTGKIGNICPPSLDTDGVGIAAFIGQDNVYFFDGGVLQPIGDFPLQGRMRSGARTRIFADLVGANFDKVVGVFVNTLSGVNFKSYWIFIPNRSIWVFNHEEFNWTRFAIGDHTKTVSVAGMTSNPRHIRIMDLVGRISEQTWSPVTLGVDESSHYCLLVGCQDGSMFDWHLSGKCETSWFLETGQLAFGDYRHEKTIKKLRLIYQDLDADVSVTLTWTSDTGQVESHQVFLGAATNKSITEIVPFNIAGHFLSLRVEGGAGKEITFSELTAIYDVGGEIRG